MIFLDYKGVRQGDPHSLFLFSMAVEALSKMIRNAQEEGLLTGLAPDLISGGVAILQYADDTVICLEHNREAAINLKLLLYIFELMSGLKINFLKSEILCVGGDDGLLTFYSDLFNCQIGHFPMRYLGVPVSFTTLRALDWSFVDDKFLKCCESWIGNSASSGGRLTLLNSSLTSIIYYYMSMFMLPKRSLRSWTSTEKNSFGRKLVVEKDTTWLNGLEFVDPKIRGDYELKISINKISASSSNGGGSWRHNKAFGKMWFGPNILRMIQFPR